MPMLTAAAMEASKGDFWLLFHVAYQRREEEIQMNKNELIAAMAEKTGLSKKDAEKALVAFMDTVTEKLANKERVQIVGFGTFEARERAARKGINPLTKESIAIDATVVPAFKAGNKLKDAVK